jgi:membrane protease YdiL (CAAX protease family)
MVHEGGAGVKGIRTRGNQLLYALHHYPHLAAAAIVILCSLPVIMLGGYADRSPRLGLSTQLGLGALAALLLTVTGWWNESGFNGPSRWRHLHLVSLPLIAVLAAIPGGVPANWRLLTYGLFTLLVAFRTEAWFRGILFRILVPAYGPRRTVTLSALLFGAVQGADLLAGAAPGVTLVKVLFAALGGYVLGALRLRTRSIWPGMLITALFFFAQHLQQLKSATAVMPVGSDTLGLQALMFLIMFGCARLWMRRVPEVPTLEGESVEAS